MYPFALIVALTLSAEASPVNVWTGADPSGSCRGTRVVVTVAGKVFACSSGTWVERVMGSGTTEPTVGYFVDSVLGTDQGGTNPCTSRAMPCKTIARLLAVAPPTGSDIWLAYGSAWKEQISGLANGVNVRAYGTDLRPAVDNRPLLDASDIVSNASFTKSGGYTNLYQITQTLTAGYQFGVWENGVRLARAASAAAADSTPGSYYAPILATGGSDTIYVHATGSSAVTTNSRTYERRVRASGIVGAYGGIIEGIRTRRNAGPNGSLISYYYAKDCLAEDGAKHNFWVEGICEDCEARYNEPPPNYGGATLFVTFPVAQGSTYGTGGAKYVRCKAVGVGDGYTIGFYAHTAGQEYSMGRLVYDGCSAAGVAVGFGGANANYFVYRNVTTSNSTTGVSGSGIVRTYVLGGTMSFNAGASIYGVAASAAGEVVVRKVRMCQYDGGSGQGWISGGGSTTLLDVKNVTFAHFGPAQFHEHIRVTDSCHLRAERNVFYGGYIQVRANTPAVIDSLDYNVYRGGPVPGTAYQNWTVSGTNYANYAAFRAAYPALEANGTASEPLFVGDLNACDTRLDPASPAVSRTAGADNADASVDAEIAGIWAQYGEPAITWPTWPYTTP